MSITLKNAANADVIYTLQRTTGDKAEYAGPNHSDLAKDSLAITSVAPRRSPTSYGNRRSSMNMIMTIVADTPDGRTETKDFKLEVVASLPVTATESEIQEIRARVASLLAQGTLVESIINDGKIQH